MTCPHCHRKTKTEIRRREDTPEGNVRREHHCSICRKSFDTVEVAMPVAQEGRRRSVADAFAAGLSLAPPW